VSSLRVRVRVRVRNERLCLLLPDASVGIDSTRAMYDGTIQGGSSSSACA